MNLLLPDFIPLSISTLAFILGAIKLFKKNSPLYFKLLICSTGCFMMQQLSLIINLWCDINEMFSIGMIGTLGCNMFLLSANYDTVDKIIDDGRNTKKYRYLAYIAPIILAILIVFSFLSWKDNDLLYASACVIVLLPSLPGSYYNLKHILLPMDSVNLLKAIRPCDICTLLYYLFTTLFLIVSPYSLIGLIVTVLLMSFSMFALSICAIKGARRWKI